MLGTTLAEADRRFGRRHRDVARDAWAEAAAAESSARMACWLAADPSAPNEVVLREERLVALATALRRLPEDQRWGGEVRHLEGLSVFFFFQAEDGIRDIGVTGVQTCALPIWFRQGPAAAPETARCQAPRRDCHGSVAEGSG